MRTKLFAFLVAMTCACGATFLSVNTAQATKTTMEMTGDGDGHCTKCGLSNGHYRCPAFYSPSNDTRCACGHSKSNHAYKR